MSYLPDGPDNTLRATWAQLAVETMARETGAHHEDLDTKVTDLLCNLVHLADVYGLAFDKLLHNALGHYTEEWAEENEFSADMPQTVDSNEAFIDAVLDDIAESFEEQADAEILGGIGLLCDVPIRPIVEMGRVGLTVQMQEMMDEYGLFLIDRNDDPDVTIWWDPDSGLWTHDQAALDCPLVGMFVSMGGSLYRLVTQAVENGE